MARPATKTLRGPAGLIAAGLAPSERLAELERVAARYAVSLTPEVAELIDPADPHDPIARQFIPDPAELDRRPEEPADPIRSEEHTSELQSRGHLVCRPLLEKKKPHKYGSLSLNSYITCSLEASLRPTY